MWVQRYRPGCLDDFISKAAVSEIRGWDGSPLIVYGATGVGKTTLVELVAKDRGWDVHLVDDDSIQSAQDIANTKSIFGGEKLVVVEDADSIRDLKALSALVVGSRSPVILTTSDYSSRRLATLKKKCKSLQIKKPLPSSISKVLALICAAEGVKCEKSVLDAVAKNASGDLRSAIHDLNALSTGRGQVLEEDLESLSQNRDRTQDIYRALSTIFGGRNLKEVISSTWDLSEQPRDIIWWVDENMPKIYREREAIGGSMEALSRSDLFLGRIQNRQYWGFLRYANALMTAGVNVCRPQKLSFTQYGFPAYFMALGRSKSQRNIEDSIAEKISPHIHTSKKQFKKHYISLFRLLISRGKMDEGALSQFRLTPEEVEYLSSA
jgi:replication factor C large subunit